MCYCVGRGLASPWACGSSPFVRHERVLAHVRLGSGVASDESIVRERTAVKSRPKTLENGWTEQAVPAAKL